MSDTEPPAAWARDDIRDRVRRVVERRLGASAAVGVHPSHARFPVPSGGDLQRACLIEPAVRCVGCGYCRSYGH